MKGQLRTLSVDEEMRLLFAVLAQPFLAAAVAFLAFPFLLLDQDGRTLAGGFPTDVTEAARSLAIVTGFVAFVVTVLGALPVAVWMMKRKQVSLGDALACGLGLANLPFFLGTALAGAHGAEGVVRGVMFSSLLGVTCSAAFWAIAIREWKPRTDTAVS